MRDSAFFEGQDPARLVAEFGSPLYVYNERVFRQRCREMRSLVSYPDFSVNFSVKANSNLTLLKIAREEGLHVDAMSPGEIYVEQAAGFESSEIFFISNNASVEEMRYAVERDILISLDSVSQLRTFGQHFPGHKVAIRVNTGVGAGHSDKVVTGGSHTKFAILPSLFDEVESICRDYDLTICGINQHIGSFFLDPEAYLAGVRALLALAPRFPALEFIDLGGGFGMPYTSEQQRLDLTFLGKALDELFYAFRETWGKPILFKIEPGRYLTAECGVLLGTVQALKENGGIHFCGTDIGFNVLIRPLLYDAYHEIEVLPQGESGLAAASARKPYTVVGNICESGDILASNRLLPSMQVGDLILLDDAGAYGYSMASNYNNRLRPAEVLIRPADEEGASSVQLIRRRDTLEDLLRGF